MTSLLGLFIAIGIIQTGIAVPMAILRSLYPAGGLQNNGATVLNAQDTPALVGQLLQPVQVVPQPANSANQQQQTANVQTAQVAPVATVQQQPVATAQQQPVATAQQQPVATVQQQPVPQAANPVQQLLAGTGLQAIPPTTGTIAVVLQNSGNPAAQPVVAASTVPSQLVAQNSLPASVQQSSNQLSQQQPVIISVSNPNFLSQAQQPQQQQQSAIQAIQPQSEVPTGTAAPVAIQQVPTATQLDPNALKPARDSAGGRPAADFSCYLLQQLQKH